MTLQTTIEPLLTSDAGEQERRKELLAEIVDRFEQARENGVETLLQNNMTTMAESFRDVLGKLEAKF